jgi:hypothetical protein
MLVMRLAVPRGVQTNTTSLESSQPRYEWWLSIIEAVICTGEVNTGKDLLGSAHVETTFL